MFFQSWASIGRIALTAALVYVVLVFALRIIGERALAKMSAYDLIVTVALGSVVASIPLQKSITVSDGLAAIFTLLILQHVLSWILARSAAARTAVKGAPTVVVFEGRLLEDHMRTINVTRDEIRAAVRSQGLASLEECLVVVLENDGNWSVIGRGEHPNRSALEGLDIPAAASDGRATSAPRSPAGRSNSSSRDVP